MRHPVKILTVEHVITRQAKQIRQLQARLDAVGNMLPDPKQLSVSDAAEYCGVSCTHFKNKVAPKLTARDFFGKKMYIVSDIDTLTDNSPLWQPSTKSTIPITLTGSKAALADVVRLENSIMNKHWKGLRSLRRE